MNKESAEGSGQGMPNPAARDVGGECSPDHGGQLTQCVPSGLPGWTDEEILPSQLTETTRKELGEHFLALFTHADQMGAKIGELRSRNVNYVLLVFAGLFGVGLSKGAHGNWSVRPEIGLALAFVMLMYDILDRRHHGYIHHWRERKAHFADARLRVMWEHEKPVPRAWLDFRHAVETQKRLRHEEWRTPQRLVYHALVGAALLAVLVFRGGW